MAGAHECSFVQNGLPPKLMIINKKANRVEIEHELPAESFTDPKTVYAQFRRARVTASGTYLAPFLKMNRVVEFHKNFKPIWTYRNLQPLGRDPPSQRKHTLH